MSTKPEVYSSVHLRERDKILEEKHRKELTFLENKLERQRRSNERTLQQVYDVQNRLDQLSRSLGFRDAYEVEMAIDTADVEMTFRECLLRLPALVREVEGSQDLKERLELLAEEMAALREQLESVKGERDSEAQEARHLRKQLNHMEEQYDSLLELKERATERYKDDYKKWRGMKNWIFSDDEWGVPGTGKELTESERKKKELGNLYRRREQIKAGCDHPPFGHTEVMTEDDEDNDKENHKQDTPVPERTKGRVSDTALLATSTPPQSNTTSSLSRPSKPAPLTVTDIGSHSFSTTTAATLKNPTLKSIINVHTAPSSSPTMFLNAPSTASTSTRIPLFFQPIPNTQVKIKQEPKSSPIIMYPLVETQDDDDQPRIPNSSDTEDSQAPDPTVSYQQLQLAAAASRRKVGGHVRANAPSHPTFKLPLPPISAALGGGSSDTEEESQTVPEPPSSQRLAAPISSAQASSSSRPIAGPSMPSRAVALPPKPSFPQISPDTGRRRKSDMGLASRMREDEDERARKVRRVSGSEFGSTTREWAQRQEDNGVDPSGSALGERGTPSEGAGAHKSTPHDAGTGTETGKNVKGKGRPFEAPISSRDRGQKHLEDYSAFKGRGRYAKDPVNSANKTINALYTIDTSKNNGLEYAYDEVVRGREKRKKMDGGDCECCRDYYDAVGPLPPRLQQPLWRSPSPCRHSRPSSSPSQGQASTSHRGRPSLSDLESHKKAISRHRQTWPRAATPPDYWDIDIPNTQKVNDINDKAKEMYRQKKEQVERAAGKDGGPWRRR